MMTVDYEEFKNREVLRPGWRGLYRMAYLAVRCLLRHQDDVEAIVLPGDVHVYNCHRCHRVVEFH